MFKTIKTEFVNYMFVKCVYFFVNKRVYLKFGGDSMKMISSAVENGSST